MRRAVCPGSFDPVTSGHLDIVRRAAALFDEVVVAVGVNPSKSRLFGPDERVAMLEQGVAGLGDQGANVRVAGFTGLITAYCREIDAQAIVKGLRSGTDFDYEVQMAHMNGHLTGVETIMLPTSARWSFVSSSLVREVAVLGGDIDALVPASVAERVHRRVGERTGKPM